VTISSTTRSSFIFYEITIIVSTRLRIEIYDMSRKCCFTIAEVPEQKFQLFRSAFIFHLASIQNVVVMSLSQCDQCCKGDASSQWEKVNLPHSRHPHPLTDSHEIRAHVITSTISPHKPHLVKIAPGVTLGVIHAWALFLSASLYVSKRGAYWDRLCRDVVGRWSLVGCHAPIVTMEH